MCGLGAAWGDAPAAELIEDGGAAAPVGVFGHVFQIVGALLPLGLCLLAAELEGAGDADGGRAHRPRQGLRMQRRGCALAAPVGRGSLLAAMFVHQQTGPAPRANAC